MKPRTRGALDYPTNETTGAASVEVRLGVLTLNDQFGDRGGRFDEGAWAIARREPEQG
jgi:hypothetical protein